MDFTIVLFVLAIYKYYIHVTMYAYKYVGVYYSFFILTCLNYEVNNNNQKKYINFLYEIKAKKRCMVYNRLVGSGLGGFYFLTKVQPNTFFFYI